MPTTAQYPVSQARLPKLHGTPPAFDTDVDADIEVDNGFFDAASFAVETLSDWRQLAAVIDHTLLKPEEIGRAHV